MNCIHKLKYNKEKDYVFCTECGKKWKINDYIPYTFPICPTFPYPNYPTYWTTSGNNNSETNGIIKE